MERIYSSSGELDELEGALHALLESGYSVDILAEHQLAPRLGEFPLVVIPNAHKLSPEFTDAVLRYVEDGGSLLLLGEKCAPLFAPQLGASLADAPETGAFELDTPLGPVNVKGPWLSATTAAAEVAGFRYPTRDFRKGGAPAATVAALGKGKIAAVYGPVALGFFRGHHPGLRRFVGGLAARLFADPAVTVDGPPTIDIALRRTADGRLALHLLNRTGFPVADRYSFIDQVPSVGPVEVGLKVAARPKQRALAAGRTAR